MPGNDHLAAILARHLQLLVEAVAHRNGHHAAFGQLRDQARRHLRRASGHHDLVERRVLRQSQAAIAVDHVHVPVAKFLQDLARLVGQFRVPLDGPHLGGQFCQHGRLVAGACPHFQHAVGRPQLQRLDHRGHHVRLRNCLTLADRDRAVRVGFPRVLGSDEPLARNLAHGRQHALVANPAPAQLLLHHASAPLGQILRANSLIKPAHKQLSCFERETLRYFFRFRISKSKLTTPFSSRIPCTVYSVLMLYSN